MKQQKIYKDRTKFRTVPEVLVRGLIKDLNYTTSVLMPSLMHLL